MSNPTVIYYNIPWLLQNMIVAPTPVTPTRQRKIAELEMKLADMTDETFVPLENIEKQKKDLTDRISRAKFNLQMSSLGYPKVDYRLLALPQPEETLPAFIIFDWYEQEDFSLTVEPYPMAKYEGIRSTNLHIKIAPNLPMELNDQFGKFAVYLGQLSKKKYNCEEVAISAEFSGTIPLQIKEEVKRLEAQDNELFDDIFVICEAPKKWRAKTSRINKDPLVVGYNWKFEKMFLIANFDLSTLEKDIMKNLSGNPKPRLGGGVFIRLKHNSQGIIGVSRGVVNRYHAPFGTERHAVQFCAPRPIWAQKSPTFRRGICLLISFSSE